MKIVGTYNLKGGVGKTTTAVNIAYHASREGYRTVLWDLDPQGSASYYFRIKPKIKGGTNALMRKTRDLDDAIRATDFEGLDLIPADFTFRNFDQSLSDSKHPTRQLLKLMRPISKEYDLLIVDCSPSISLVSENIFYAADALLIPVIPTTLAVRTYSQLVNYFKKAPSRHLTMMPFFSMYNKRRILQKEIKRTFPREHDELLSTIIPDSKTIEIMGINRSPVAVYAPLSKPAQAYERLWGEIRQRVF